MPTIHALIRDGRVRARREPRGRGGRFRWRIDSASVDEHLALHGRYDQPTSPQSRLRLTVVAARVESLEAQVQELLARPDSHTSTGRDLADARARIVNLEEALERAQAASDLRERVESARSELVLHLIDAVKAAAGANELQRQVEAELQAAIRSFSTPGHVWGLTSTSQQAPRSSPQ